MDPIVVANETLETFALLYPLVPSKSSNSFWHPARSRLTDHKIFPHESHINPQIMSFNEWANRNTNRKFRVILTHLHPRCRAYTTLTDTLCSYHLAQ